MPLPFDATLKELAQQNPRDFLAAFDPVPAGPVQVLNVDLSTVTTSADLVFGVGDPVTEIVHLDCQSSASESLHRDVLVYNALLHRRYQVPVHSMVLLLRRQAQHSNLNGAVRYEARPGRGRMEFSYEVIALWQRPVEELLAGSIGTLPLAPLGKLPEGAALAQGLAPVVQRLVERLQQEAPPEHMRRLLTAAFVLTGMRVNAGVARELFRGVQTMHESSTYQWILDQGAIAALQRTLLRHGRERFGPPDAATEAGIKAITDPERLDRLVGRMFTATSWQDLLQTP